MFDIAVEIRHAIQSLRRRPLWAATIVGTLALGIGASTAIFSIVSKVLLEPLPFAHPEQLVSIWDRVPSQPGETPLGGQFVKLAREQKRAFSGISAFRARLFNLGEAALPVRLDGIEVTGEFFSTMGVTPALGRFFTTSDEPPPDVKDAAAHVVVLSSALWRRQFQADPGIVGRSIQLDGMPYTVVAVAQPGFDFPRGGEMPPTFQFPDHAELWTPLTPPLGGPWELAAVGRLASGVTIVKGQEDLDRVSRLEEQLVPATKGWVNTTAVALRTQTVGDVSVMLRSLLGGVALLLLIGCANAAQLFLAAAYARRRELAVRTALGASALRTIRMLLVESSLLAVAAGALGLLAAMEGINLVKAYGPSRFPRLADVTTDSHVLIIGFGLTLLTATLFAVAPALWAARTPLEQALRLAGRGTAGKEPSLRTRRALIAGEIALALVLVVSSTLLMRSLGHQLRADVGFVANHAVTFEVTLPPTAYPETQHRASMEYPKGVLFISRVLDKIGALPGVVAAAIGKPLPLSGAEESSVFFAEGQKPPVDDAHTPMAEVTVASPGMLAALGNSLVAGRDFGRTDQEHSLPVVIINESMARWLWPGQSAVGKHLHMGSQATAAPWMTVVGVTHDLHRYALTDVPRPEMILPYTQDPYPTYSPMQFVVRSAGDPTALVSQIRREVASVDPSIAVARVRTLDALIGTASERARFITTFMASFGTAAIMLALIGIYGVVAYSTQQRRQEMGVRRALGATQSQIARLVLSDTATLVVGGVAAGVVGALLATRALQSLLYDVPATDLVSFTAAVLVLGATGIVGCLIPALRAARTEPRVALEDRA